MSVNMPLQQEGNQSLLQLAIEPPKPVSPNIPVSEEEEKAIVSICRKTKEAMISHAQDKKETMRTCYAYYKNQLVENDLLQLPAMGDSKGLDSQRPKVFYPLIKQQVDLIYSQVKLTFFPDDSNYCRVKGQNPLSAQVDEQLTEGFMLLLRKMKASEKMGTFILNSIWSGNASALPYIKRRTVWEWEMDEMNSQYVPVEKELEAEVDIETFNPINFYLDPTVADIEYSKWAYYSVKKVRELIDNPLYFNTDNLDKIAKETVLKNTKSNGLDLAEFNGLNTQFDDSEKNIDYDLFYFPYMKTPAREYRNMIIGIAGESSLVRFHPNMFPKGVNPVVFTTWSQDIDSQYGTGVAEQIKNLQRLINIIANYKLEQMARFGNRLVVTPQADINNLWGIAGGIAVAENPRQDVMELSMNFSEISQLDNTIAILKAEAEQTASAGSPFQGASNIDPNKTATEVQLRESNSLTNNREKVEHIRINGIEPLLQKILHLFADIYKTPQTLRKEDGNFVTVDFSVIKNPEYSFTVELVGSNPSQSKQAEVASWSELVQMVAQQPQALEITEPIIKKIAELQGIKDIDEVLNEIKERIARVFGQGSAQVQELQDGMGASPQPLMDGLSEADIGSQGGF